MVFIEYLKNLFKREYIDLTLIQLMLLEKEYNVHHMWELRPFLKDEFNATITMDIDNEYFIRIIFRSPKYKTFFLLKHSELLNSDNKSFADLYNRK